MGYILKLVIFFIAAWVVISFIKKLTQSGNEEQSSNKPSEPESMNQCARCGVYIPHSKTKIVSGKYICADCQNHNKQP